MLAQNWPPENINDPRHKKTCLQFVTMSNSNQPAQLQKLVRVLELQ